jgi:hypothetical protein
MYDHFLDESSVSRRSSVVDTGELLVTDSGVGRDIGEKFSSVRYITADSSNNVSVQVGSEIRSIHALTDVDEFVSKLGLGDARSVLIDITYLPAYVWAPAIRHLLQQALDVRVMFSEPQSYPLWPQRTDAVQDLASCDASDASFCVSRSASKSSPLPTFATIRPCYRDEPVPLVVFLGFEGWRVANVLDDLEVEPERIIPVIGCPGYKIDYPGFSVSANHHFLLRPDWSTRLRLVSARSPFAVFSLLESLLPSQGRLFVAPLGTTPMLLGSILFGIKCPQAMLVYDHPVRVLDPQAERGRTWFYNLKSFGAGK